MISLCRPRMSKYVSLFLGLCLVVPVAFSQTTDQDSTSQAAQDSASEVTQDSTSQASQIALPDPDSSLQPKPDSRSQPAEIAAAQPPQDSTAQPVQESNFQAKQNSTSNSCDPSLTAGPAGSDPCLQARNEQPSDPTAAALRPVAATYTPALNGGPPILLQQPKHLRFLYGVSTSQGYDTNIVGPFQNIDTYTSTYEGYLAAAWRFTRSYVILQQDSTYTHFGSPLLQQNGFHQTALLSTLDFNPNLNWIFEATSAEGNNTLTQLIAPSQMIVNGVAVTSPSAATAGLNLGVVWGTDVVSTLNWKPDRHNIFALRAENANHQFYDRDVHDNFTTLQLSYQRALSQNTHVGGYGLTRRQTGTIFCDGVGLGLIGSTRPAEHWFIEASGGPEFDSGGCRRHQGFDLHLATTYQLSSTSQLYGLGNREYSSGFVPNATWEDNAAVGLVKRLRRRLTWDVGVGYARGFTGGFQVPASNLYHGFYSQTKFIQQLSKSFNLEALYRRFDQRVGGESVHRNIVLFTMRWSPLGHDARRTAMYPYRSAELEDSRSAREE
jgi:hypothetical protein